MRWRGLSGPDSPPQPAVLCSPMAVHTIMMPDWMRGLDLRAVVWDDVAGTVEGDHWSVLWLQEMLAGPRPLLLPNEEHDPWTLRDPGRDPSEFLILLGRAYWPILHADRDLHRLPPILRDAQLPPMPPRRRVFGPDGRELTPGVDFVY